MKKITTAILALWSVFTMFAAENLANISWGDNIMVGNGIAKLDTIEKIEQYMKILNDFYDTKTILWRVDDFNMTKFYERRALHNFQIAYNKKTSEIFAQFDPCKVAKTAAHKNGQELYIYTTFMDHGMPHTYKYADTAPFPWQDKMFIEHPEYNEVDLAGNCHYGIPNLANAEFRKKMIERLVYLVNLFDPDGLYLCSRTHTNPAIHGDQFGFNKEVVAEYQKRYGIDITKDKRFDYRSPEYAPKSKEVQAWRDLRGEYLVQFVAELRKALGNKKLLLALPVGKTYQAPFGNMTLDKKSIISNGYIDGIVTNVFTGRGLYPKRTTHHRDLGYLESSDYSWNIPSPAAEVAALRSYTKNPNFKIYYSLGYYNNIKITGANGNMFSAMNFQSTPVVRDNGGLYNKTFTIEGFFNLNKHQKDFSKNPRLVSKYSHTSGTYRGWEIYCGEDGKIGFRTQLTNGKGKNIDLTLNSKSKIKYGEWIHVAAVLDDAKKEKRIYINGQLDAVQKIAPDMYLYNNKDIDLVIGNYSYGTEVAVAFDELRMSSNADFQGVPKTPYTGKEPGTVFLFHFDEIFEKTTANKGIQIKYSMTPPFCYGVFGLAMDLRQVD